MSRAALPLLYVLPALLLPAAPPGGNALGQPRLATKAVSEQPLAKRAFDPSVARLAPDAAERTVLEALAAGDSARALSLASAALPKASASTKGRLLWLSARASEGDDAEKYYRQLAHSQHPLARWAALRCAEHLRAEDPARAAEIAGKLTTADWSGAARARTLNALALYEAEDFARAEPLLRALVEGEPQHSAAATAGMPLAAILSRREDLSSKLEALALYRRVASRAPLSTDGQEAERQATALLSRMPPKLRKQHLRPSIEDEFQRGEALLQSRELSRAKEHFDGLIERVSDDEELRCKAELEAGRAIERQRSKRKEAARYMSALAERCTAPEVRTWARYYSGRAHLRSAAPEEAIEQLSALVREAPEHRLADDALQLSAAAHEDLDEPDRARATLEQLVERYPQGDMRPQAAFKLAFETFAAGDYKRALAQLDSLIAGDPDEHAEGYEGRAAYWRARSLAALGRRSQAVEAYSELVRAVPLSYHAQQALHRLRELDRKRTAALERELGGKKRELGGKKRELGGKKRELGGKRGRRKGKGQTDAMTFARRPEMDTASFGTALELLRISEVDLAEHELRHLGALGSSADDDMLWLVATLLHNAGAYPEASRLVRWRLRSYRTAAPVGEARQRWRIAFPHAFAPLIEQAAREASIPASFVRAVAREESAFDPEAVSSANAYGLIQLIVPTAREHARALGLPSDPSSLKRPEINLRIGSHFIRDLWKRYASNPAVVPAGYNAGRGAANRWLRERPDMPLDEWIEHIPYRETRRYTRRVLQSYGVYHFLDHGSFPPLKRKLPAAG